MYISLDSYRVFCCVAQCRSFTKAAEMLYSNQPNVTRAIKKLEQALGCALFIRSSRSVQLTPEGEALYTHVKEAMQQIQAGEETVLRHTTLRSGTVSIGTSEIALHQVLLPALEWFRKEYPEIRLRIFNSNSQQAVSALKDGLVDFSLLTLPAEQAEQYHRTDIAAFQEVPVCGRCFFDGTAPQNLEEISQFPLISLCGGTSTHTLYSAWFRRHGLTFAPDIEAATADQILPLVRAGLGIGFLPEKTAREAEADGSIRILELTEQLPERTICLLKRKNVPLSIAAERLERIVLSGKIL